MLALTGADDALTNRSGWFFSALTGNISILHGGHFDVEVNAIEQGTGDAVPITLYLGVGTSAFAFRIAEIAARASIRCLSVSSSKKGR